MNSPRVTSPTDSDDDYAILEEDRLLRQTSSTDSEMNFEDPRYVDRNQVRKVF